MSESKHELVLKSLNEDDKTLYGHQVRDWIRAWVQNVENSACAFCGEELAGGKALFAEAARGDYVAVCLNRPECRARIKKLVHARDEKNEKAVEDVIL